MSFTINFDRLDKMAWNGSVDEIALPWYENIYFQNMAWLCRKVKDNQCDKKTAAEFKGHLRNECNELISGYEFGIKMADHTAQLFKDTEIARAAYRKDRTLENADAMLGAIDGVLREVID